jgi:myo-inositol-1(or 4)-monophosphatase
MGSAALDLACVACGRFDGYWESGIREWDVAAGSLIVGEAGGSVTRYKGDAFELSKQEILATNGKIHESVSELLTLT